MQERIKPLPRTLVTVTPVPDGVMELLYRPMFTYRPVPALR
ncbi:hypothetical protein AB0D11_45615 [Streptomyces monashensis]